VLRGAPRGRPLTPATNSSAPIRHRPPGFLQRLSGTPAKTRELPRAHRALAHHASVKVGDLAVVRDDKVVLGTGRIDVIQTGTAFKVRPRCPSCRSTNYKFRRSAALAFRCSACMTEFADTDESDVRQVRTYVADYSASWRPADTFFPASALSDAYVNRAVQHSIRQLELHALGPILRSYLMPDAWWADAPGTTGLGGGFTVILSKSRLGQQRFREEMLRRYGPRCAMTGSQPPETLEAAHIRSYSRSPRHDKDNGLLLRRDLHALFDRGLITVDPQTWTVEVAPALMSYPGIAKLHGSPLDLAPELRPRSALITEHAAIARSSWQRIAE
jgi:ribosomal protein L37AE/L43A